MVTKRVPSPKFDLRQVHFTKSLHEVLRDFKQYKIVTRGGTPYSKLYINGDLDAISAAVDRVIGVGSYTITHYWESWYCVELVTVAQKPGNKQGASRPKKAGGSDLLTMRWTNGG